MGQEKSKITPIITEKIDLVQLINIFPQDIWNTILTHANEDGLLQEYRVHTQVCKGLLQISKLSIRKLDLITVATNSPYRTCTLLAHIVSERILQQFTNLKVLHISFKDLNIFELYEKITSNEYRGVYLSNKINKDDKLTEYDAEFKHGLEVMSVVTKPGYVSETFAENMKLTGDILKGMWAMVRIVQNTTTPFSLAKKKQITPELYTLLHKLIIDDMVCTLNLEELYMDTCFDVYLKFVENLPQLNRLRVSVSTALESGAVAYLIAKDISNVYHQNIIHFETGVDTIIKGNRMGNVELPINWKRLFPNIKSICMDMSEYIDDEMDIWPEPNFVIESVVASLPDIEDMTILALSSYKQPYDRPFKYLSQLKKLKRLDVSHIGELNRNDLRDICEIQYLQELVLPEQEPVSLLIGGYLYQQKIRKLRPDINVFIKLKTVPNIIL